MLIDFRTAFSASLLLICGNAFLLALTLYSQTSFAISKTGATPDEKINAVKIGVVEIPGPVRLFREPAIDSEIIAQVTNAKDFLSEEISPGVRGAWVFEARAPWYLVETKSGKGWLPGKDAGKYHPLAELLKVNMSLLTASWDGSLWENPEQKKAYPNSLSLGNTSRSVVVADSAIVSGQLWLKVELLEKSQCETALPVADIKRKAVGWIPAHSPKGELKAWIKPGGCD